VHEYPSVFKEQTKPKIKLNILKRLSVTLFEILIEIGNFNYFDLKLSNFKQNEAILAFFVSITLTSTLTAFSRSVKFHYVMSMKLKFGTM